MTPHVLILGAGFGGLELAARLSEAATCRVTLIDQGETFAFGFSKLDVAFRGAPTNSVLLPYRAIALPGVEFRQERVVSIDPVTRHVETDSSSYEPDLLVVALGADYDPAATPGFVEGGHEFYTLAGAARLHEELQSFAGGTVLVAILGVPFKCPPAPYEGALLLHEALVARGVREDSTIEVITPMPAPIPPSPQASAVIVQALTDRGINYTPGERVRSLDVAAKTAKTKTADLPYDLFVGIPVHRSVDVVVSSGLTVGGADGWVAVDPRTLQTSFPGVYALGDCADAPVPRAGVFAESAAAVVADHILATLSGESGPDPYAGTGVCYLELGDGTVGKIEADFLSGPAPRAPLLGPSEEYAAEKADFAAVRRRRWFGLS